MNILRFWKRYALLIALVATQSIYADDANAFIRRFRKKNIPKTEANPDNPLEWLRSKGLNFSPTAYGSTAWDIAGGRKRTTDGNFEYLVDLNLKIESDKFLKYKGGILCADFQLHRGGNPAKDAGSYEFLALIEAPNFTQLSELWYRQDFDGSVWVKAGKNDGSLFFAYSDNAAYFQNGGFENVSTIRQIPSYPTPAMGVLVGVHPLPWIELKGAVYDGSVVQGVNTGTLGVFGKFFDHLHKHAFFIGEADFSWKTASGLDGHIRVGGWGNTSHVPKYSGGIQKGLKGAYGLIDQSVWKPTNNPDEFRGVGIFAEYGITSPAASPVKQAYVTGFSWTGPFEKRKNDVLGFGAGMQRFSLEPGSGFTEPAEVDIELFYVYIPKKWLNIQPDIQYIVNPGGTGTPNALVVLFNMSVSL